MFSDVCETRLTEKMKKVLWDLWMKMLTIVRYRMMAKRNIRTTTTWQ